MQVRLPVEVVGMEIDLRKLPQVVEQNRRHDLLAEKQGHAQVEPSARLAVQATGRRFGLLQLSENALAVDDEAFPGFGQRYPTRAALQQHHVQAALQRVDGAGHSRGREFQLAGCRRQAERLTYGEKDLHLLMTIHGSGLRWRV